MYLDEGSYKIALNNQEAWDIAFSLRDSILASVSHHALHCKATSEEDFIKYVKKENKSRVETMTFLISLCGRQDDFGLESGIIERRQKCLAEKTQVGSTAKSAVE